MKEKKREPEKPTIVEQHSSSTVDRRGERDPRMMKAVLRDKVDASKKIETGVHLWSLSDGVSVARRLTAAHDRHLGGRRDDSRPL